MPSPPSLPFSSELTAYIDGGSRGNPGPAGYGVLLEDASGNAVDTLSEFIGVATNNVAEYRALLAALEYAVQKQQKRLKINCDSELVVKQMQGRYRVQSPDLKPLFERARKLAGQLDAFSIHHIPRERNHHADRLANQAMDNGALPKTNKAVTFRAVFEHGKLKPLTRDINLEDGAEYDVQARKRSTK
ncbi:MAG: hypothetical protein A3F68_02965 [Acidobacteria bacterium RIFCSPLOWO2_12_FULL_54_10]|nr:MAG: hypothetical protein A3F68_02965 [Acidobacteria bacterium RIFCSPLOWO2_12_FULL_54_10]